MNDPTILFVKPGAITPADKTALHDAGVVVVEIENPRDVKLVRAGCELPASGMLAAAIKCIADSNSDSIRHNFVHYMSKLMPFRPEPPCS